jgi:two-component system nitrate/nitrite response regulator NarL
MPSDKATKTRHSSEYAEIIATEHPVRVILIDDHALFRSGLSELLERRGIKVMAAVGEGYEGIRLAQELPCDLILLDIRMPNLDGLETLHRLRKAGISVPIIMLTTSHEDQDVVQTLRDGAQGYLLKDMEPDELVKALYDVLSGGTVVAPELAGVLARVVREGKPSSNSTSPFAELTPREMEILKHLAEGQSNKVIGRELGIADGTVKLHVKSILRKLGIRSRVEAAVIAVEHGLTRKN